MTNGISVRRRFIGRALHHYRQVLGFTLDDVAELLECDRSKVSRMETGHRGVKSKELRELLEWYGASEAEQGMLLAIEESTRGRHRGFWHDYATVLPGAALEHIVIEQHAARVLTYAPLTVPALLQTPAYAEALAAANPAIPSDHETDAADLVQLRQRRLVEGGNLELEAVIGEAALRQPAGDQGIMREQLRRIFELASESRRITVRVLRSSSGMHAVQGAGHFSILRFDSLHSLGLVHLDGPQGGTCLDDRAEIDAYVSALVQAQAAALNPTDSLGFIRKIIKP